jgi:hypothetical protein
MNKTDFIDTVQAILSIDSFVNQLLNVGVDITDSAIFNYGIIADILWKSYYTDEGVDVINAYLYENKYYDSVEDLYNDLQLMYLKNV